MPVTGSIISGYIKANFSGSKILGRNAGDIADAVGMGVATHITTPNMLIFSCSGFVGPIGTATSTSVAGIVPTAMAELMKTRAAQLGFGMGGRDMPTFFSAISRGVSTAMLSSIAQGNMVGIAVGTGTAKLTNISAQVLSGLIKNNLMARGIVGRDSGKIAECIAFGVVTHLKAGANYSIVVAGAISPVAPTGPIPIAGIAAVYSKIS